MRVVIAPAMFLLAACGAPSTPPPVISSQQLDPAPPPPPPPPPAPAPAAEPAEPPDAPPTTIKTKALEAQRISGHPYITPDDQTKAEIQMSCTTRLVIPVKICLDETGTPIKTEVLRATEFPAYDRKIEREMMDWRYTPFIVNGKAARVCSAVTFVYSQPDPLDAERCAAAAQD